MSLFEEEAMKDYNFQKVVKAGAMALLRTGFWIIATVKKIMKAKAKSLFKDEALKDSNFEKSCEGKGDVLSWGWGNDSNSEKSCGGRDKLLHDFKC